MQIKGFGISSSSQPEAAWRWGRGRYKVEETWLRLQLWHRLTRENHNHPWAQSPHLVTQGSDRILVLLDVEPFVQMKPYTKDQ